MSMPSLRWFTDEDCVSVSPLQLSSDSDDEECQTKINSQISVLPNLSGENEIDDPKCIVLRSGRKGT